MHRRGRPGFGWAGALLIASAIGSVIAVGSGCKRTPTAAKSTVPPPNAAPAPGRSLSFGPTPDGFGLALPESCTLRAPSVRALLDGRSVYFVAADEPTGGLVVIDRAPLPAAVWASFGSPARAAPPFDFENPKLAYDGATFRGLYAAGPTDARTVVVTGATGNQVLATGDALSVVDFRCREGRCVALLPRIGLVASAGISLLTGDSTVRSWTRRDIDLADTEKPLGITALGQGRRTAFATTLGDDVLVREVDETTIKPHPPLTLPFGVLDTALLPGDRAVAIGHGARVVGDCAAPRPAAALVREGLAAITLPTSAPLLHAVVRPLGTGGIVVYSAALHCRDDRKRFVTAQLLDATGEPRGPSMVIAEARGFAVSTRDEDVDFVVLRENEIVVARARCPSP